ncbi:MAG: PorV/PorQ family protein [Ignavibacteria bacterium]|nr:PorV/PorQ family protein [Ignavibacteria bacterium]
MNQINKIFLLVIVGILASNIYGQQKLAQTGFNFLEVTSDARASGMGDAVNAVSGYSDALFHNPAGMADITNFFSGTFSINKWIADINYMTASAVLAPANGDYGVVGFSLQSIDYGDIQGTVVDPGYSGYRDIGNINPVALSIGIGYAKMLNDKFSVGVQVKYAYQSLGSSQVPDGSGGIKESKNEAEAIAVDFGTLYKTGYKSLAFGMSVRNYSKEVKFKEEGFQLPLLFTIGISADLFDFIEVGGPEQSLLLAVDATHPRARAEQVKVGLEYQFMDIVSLRGGYIFGNDLDDITYGIGLSQYGFGVDYAYTPFGKLGNVQRFSARISL